MLNVDSYGLDFHWGRFSVYINNAEMEEPGSFALHVPLPYLGVCVVGWESSDGWDLYRITPSEANLLRWVTEKAHDGHDMASALEDPTDAELAEIQAAMAIEEILDD